MRSRLGRSMPQRTGGKACRGDVASDAVRDPAGWFNPVRGFIKLIEIDALASGGFQD
ncbi:hypothetical protein L0Z64_11915 [Phaeobacter sp. BS23]|uniref:hypothetical protein n=1 Tax=Phaeobacter sp. BS23 TaxID=2907239 RepID=UPI00386C8162